jgi:stalled ribosome rescue protein Dom34
VIESEGDAMTQVHAIVWLDHREARIIEFSMGKSDMFEVRSDSTERRIHHKTNTIGAGKAADNHPFFDEIAAAVDGTREVLIAGPGNAKTAFRTYVEGHHPDLARRIVGVETLDHPTDRELLAHARSYFNAVDQLGLT